MWCGGIEKGESSKLRSNESTWWIAYERYRRKWVQISRSFRRRQFQADEESDESHEGFIFERVQKMNGIDTEFKTAW